MTETDSSPFHGAPDGSLKAWVVHRLVDLRDRMKSESAASDVDLAAATRDAERKIGEAERILRSPRDL